jgi:hypothetical protein
MTHKKKLSSFFKITKKKRFENFSFNKQTQNSIFKNFEIFGGDQKLNSIINAERWESFSHQRRWPVEGLQ